MVEANLRDRDMVTHELGDEDEVSYGGILCGVSQIKLYPKLASKIFGPS